jgi:methionyl-tRNA formyltransferase
MSAGLDAGDMLAKASIPIGEETAGELEAKLAPLGARLAVETIQRLKAGPVTGEKQDPSQVTKAPKLTKEMGLIDWTQPAERICRQVRAMQPWPTAYTYLHRAAKEPMRVIINSVVEFPVRCDPALQPGTPFVDRYTAPGKSLFVAVAEVLPGEERGVVEVLELQPAGKKRMTAEEFLRGHPLKDGDRFGPEVVS